MAHLWLPKAHVEAPVAGRIILAGILLKLGGYGIVRIILITPRIFYMTRYIIASISAVGCLLTAIICTRQPDLKSIIAYASVSHIALILLGVFLVSSWRLSGALLMIVAHGLTSSCLFATANTIYETTKSRRIVLSKGIYSISPLISISLFVALATNIRAPPSINLMREIFLLINIIGKSVLATLIVAIISFYTAVYSLLIYTSTQHSFTREYISSQNILPQYANTSGILHLVPLRIFILSPNLLVP